MIFENIIAAFGEIGNVTTLSLMLIGVAGGLIAPERDDEIPERSSPDETSDVLVRVDALRVVGLVDQVSERLQAVLQRRRAMFVDGQVQDRGDPLQVTRGHSGPEGTHC